MQEDELIAGFGERLRVERERLKLTQDELAQRCGIKPQTIHQYEKGRTFPTIALIYSLRKFGFNIPYLVSGGVVVPKPNEIPPETFHIIVDMVTKIETEMCKEPLSNETKLRLMLILLGQYVETPSSLPLTHAQCIDLLVKA